MEPLSWLHELGPTASGVFLLGIGIKYLGDFILKLRKRSTEAREAPLTDSVTANSTLLSTLHGVEATLASERAEGERKDSRIADLENRNAELHQQLIDQRSKYDKQLRDMEIQVNHLTDQLSQLRRELNIENNGDK